MTSFHPYRWGDFWRTGHLASTAVARHHGIRREGVTPTEHRQHWVAERRGPRGGVEIRYSERRLSYSPVGRRHRRSGDDCAKAQLIVSTAMLPRPDGS